MIMYAITRTDWIAIVGSENDETGYYRLVPEYSGRGMFGETCFGFTCSGLADYTRWIVEATIYEDLVGNLGWSPEDLAINVQTDNLGLDTIYYFPGIKFAEE